MDKTSIETSLGKEGIEHLIQQAHEFWWAPEIEHRKNTGKIDSTFQMRAAQALFPPDGKAVVRFNDEVRGIAHVRVSHPVEKGGKVYEHDLDGLEAFDLEEEDLDNGHFTMIKKMGGWFISFNFMSCRKRCTQLLKYSRDFLDVARISNRRGKSCPAIDNLFSACELVSKAHLILNSMIKNSVKTHSPVHSGINKWRRLGNIDADFVELFNWLTKLRPRCRYEGGRIEITQLPESKFALVEAEIARLEGRCQQISLTET